MSDFEAMMRAYEQAGGDPKSLRSPDFASLVVSGNMVLSSTEVQGISIDTQEISHGVKARIMVAPGTRLPTPVHLCFGMLPAQGLQEIESEFDIGPGAEVSFLAHCTFPNATRVKHLMRAKIRIGAGASLRYSETHYHGQTGGIEVIPQAEVSLEEKARFHSTFALTTGRVGRLDLDYVVDVADHAIAELLTRAYGFGTDTINVKEEVRLNGEYARGLAKSRIALRQQAKAVVTGAVEGNAPYVRGHVDCVEIVQEQAEAQAVPIVRVRDDRARVTHEAAIGSVNRKELETLTARGLTEEKAIEVIIRGMLEG